MSARLIGLCPGSGPARRARLAVALTAITATASCGGSSSGGAFQPSGTFGGPSAPPATTAAPPPSALPTAQVDQTVLQRYREYQRVYKQVYETNDPAPLAAVATDPLLTDVTQDVEKTRSKGEIWRFTNVLNPKIQGRSTDGTQVIVLDCVRTLGAYRYSARTGERLGSLPGGTALYQVFMRYDAGTWKASKATLGKKC
ncbi:hypothetical protein ABZ801_28240 [Actinomadura sp. NPDC047616]|uniref:hypothetical protein n=1 Tax=Actinomadura sp. NPDC047616 TaxID=3155914 RepID=UPI0033F44F5A